MTILEEIQDSLKLSKANRICTIQGSLAIEGNTLSTEQIMAILNGKAVIALQAHQILMNDLIDDVGQYRHGGVSVMSGDRVVNRTPPDN